MGRIGCSLDPFLPSNQSHSFCTVHKIKYDVILTKWVKIYVLISLFPWVFYPTHGFVLYHPALRRSRKCTFFPSLPKSPYIMNHLHNVWMYQTGSNFISFFSFSWLKGQQESSAVSAGRREGISGRPTERAWTTTTEKKKSSLLFIHGFTLGKWNYNAFRTRKRNGSYLRRAYSVSQPATYTNNAAFSKKVKFFYEKILSSLLVGKCKRFSQILDRNPCAIRIYHGGEKKFNLESGGHFTFKSGRIDYMQHAQLGFSSWGRNGQLHTSLSPRDRDQFSPVVGLARVNGVNEENGRKGESWRGCSILG